MPAMADQHVDRAQASKRSCVGCHEQLTNMGQEAVVVADEARQLERVSRLLQASRGFRAKAERFLDQDRLAGGEHPPADLAGAIVGKGDDRRIETVWRNVREVAIVRNLAVEVAWALDWVNGSCQLHGQPLCQSVERRGTLRADQAMTDHEDPALRHRRTVSEHPHRTRVASMATAGADGRHVLVVGGSMGIGRACALRLATDGWRVTVAARGHSPIEETLALLPGEGHQGVRLDVSRVADWEAESGRLSRLEALVFAAGVIGPV